MNGMYDLRIGQGPSAAGRAPGASGAKNPDDAGFAALLKSKSDELKFSAHAQSRVKSRNLSVTPQVMDKLNKAVSGAASKGAKDSLVLLNNMAFIVNIPNRTIVTAMDGESIRDNVFTNIDSTVIAG
jgi:flagellar operon protein